MHSCLPIEEFLDAAERGPIVDARSPSEFARAHIPGARNVALFDDEERARIGTAYKQVGRRDAIKIGLDAVGPKMRALVEAGESVAEGSGRVRLHCWRGGMRSGAVAWLWSLYGLEVTTLEGGYKAFRRWAIERARRPPRLAVLSGRTGSGKTEILEELARAGEQILDLEGMANHRGSAFGAIGLGAQPSSEMFENELAWAIEALDFERRVWVEDESRAIGRVGVPEAFWVAMCAAPTFAVEVPIKARLARLVETYGAADRAELAAAFDSIRRRLGSERCARALEALERGAIEEAARCALHYYDRAYDHALTRSKTEPIRRLEVAPDQGSAAIARALIEAAGPA